MTRNSCSARLLLIDDSPDVLLLWRVVLEVHGGFVDIIEAPDGERALQLMAAAQPEVIVTDHWMHGVSGFDVIDAARSLCPRAVVVMSSSDPSAGPEALRRGASCFLPKFSSVTDELASTIHALLGKVPGDTPRWETLHGQSRAAAATRTTSSIVSSPATSTTP